MVSAILLNLALLAHGADPRPISGDEATANLVKFFVTIFLALMMVTPVLAPLFRADDSKERSPQEQAPPKNLALVGWVGIGLMLVLSMSWWLARTSLVELTTKEAPLPDHTHTIEQGGQMAMWSDFHAEVSRIESGEVRIHLSDSYNRPIAARFFQAEIVSVEPTVAPTSENSPAPTVNETPVPRASATPTDDGSPRNSLGINAVETSPALNDTYRFAVLPREAKAYRVRVKTPGWSVTLKFEFDEGRGRRSLPIWCGTR